MIKVSYDLCHKSCSRALGRYGQADTTCGSSRKDANSVDVLLH